MRRRVRTTRGLFTSSRANERGQALAMTLVTIFSLSIVVVTVMLYAGSTTNSAADSGGSESAYDLAEAGLNDAYSAISVAGSDTTNIPVDPSTNVKAYGNGATESWGASYDAPTRTWTVTSIGTHINPAGGNPLKRTLTGKLVLTVPPYTFASLTSTCDKHTLLVNSSGTLTVTNGIYVNSCDTGHDAFDVMGSGGSISAPSINVVGGWETHSGDLVIVNGVTCSLLNDNPPDAYPPAGCPKVGQPPITDPFAGKITAPSLGTPACTNPIYGAAASYSPTKQKLNGNITAAQTAISVVGTAVQTGDVIVIDTENMLVTGGGGTSSITVQRAYNGTTANTHSNGKEIKYLPVTGTAGTALTPAPCDIPSGTIVLNPGTYYGGICIGASSGTDCGSNIGGNCTTTATGTANVTLNPGTYVMAGGGFFVCGSSTLSAPDVFIYNTQDPSNTAGSGAIDQVLLNTTGSVNLGPQNTGVYQGLTIFQNSSLAVAPTTMCDAKKDSTKVDLQDVALYSMASTGPNGAFGSISGTIYLPGPYAMFATGVSGTANLAVLSSCMLIDGGNSTFAFQPGGLFGVADSIKVTGQYG